MVVVYMCLLIPVLSSNILVSSRNANSSVKQKLSRIWKEKAIFQQHFELTASITCDYSMNSSALHAFAKRDTKDRTDPVTANPRQKGCTNVYVCEPTLHVGCFI
jgi:hypothetical protein